MSWVFAGSPFKVLVTDEVDPSKVRVTGPGVSSGVRARLPQSFTVDCSKAGQAPLAVSLTNPKGRPSLLTILLPLPLQYHYHYHLLLQALLLLLKVILISLLPQMPLFIITTEISTNIL